MKKTTFRVEIILLAGILISFFLPWVDFTFFSISGYEIPIRIANLENFSNTFSNQDQTSPIVLWSYTLYLIPFLSISALILNIIGKQKRVLEKIVASIPIIIVLFFYLVFGNQAFNTFTIGIYLTLFLSISLIIYSFTYKKKVENINESNSEILTQLEKLYILKEKGALTDDFFEKERKLLTDKLEQNESVTVLQQDNSRKSSFEMTNKSISIIKKSAKYKKAILISSIILFSLIGVFFCHNLINDKSDLTTDEIINPKEIIRNPEIDKKFKEIVNTKNPDYDIEYQKQEYRYNIKLKNGNELYLYIPYTESVEGYTYYTNKNIKLVRQELENYGVKFNDEYIGYAGDEYSSCYRVELEIKGDIVVVNYSYECD